MNKSYARYIWILPALWMCVIFVFSNQPSDDSSQLSGEVTRVIESIAEFMHINTARFDLHLFIRKAAHFTEFAILGFLLFIAIYPAAKAFAQDSADGKAISRKAAVKAGLLSQAVGMGYAVFDEVHQSFIPGRSCQLKDMLIDSSGVLLSILLCYAYTAVRSYLRKA
jgi:VanZ family protein